MIRNQKQIQGRKRTWGRDDISAQPPTLNLQTLNPTKYHHKIFVPFYYFLILYPGGNDLLQIQARLLIIAHRKITLKTESENITVLFKTGFFFLEISILL